MSKFKRPKITLKLISKAEVLEESESLVPIEVKKFAYDLSSDEEESESESVIQTPLKVKKFSYDLSSDEEDDDDRSEDDDLKMYRKSKNNSTNNSNLEETSDNDFIWDMLPDEVLLRIGHYISRTYYDLMTIRVVCRRFLRVFSDVTLVTLTSKQMATVEKIFKSEYYSYVRSWIQFDPKTVISCGVGTGKTVIALNAIRKYLDSGKAQKVLIMAPEILFYEWKRAFERWCSNLPDLKEYHRGLTNNEIYGTNLDDYEIVLTKNGLSVSKFKSGYIDRYNSVYTYNFKNLMKRKNLTTTECVVKNLISQKWDLIICDDMQSIPKVMQAIIYNLKEYHKHPFKLFSLNASDRRKKNLVDYGVDEELPPKPKLKVKIYLYKYIKTGELEKRGHTNQNATDVVFEHVQNMLTMSDSKTKFGIYSDPTDRAAVFGVKIRNNYGDKNQRSVLDELFPGYENIDGVYGTERKMEKLKEFEAGKINSLFSYNGTTLIKGHNLYPQEVNFILLSDMHNPCIKIRERRGYYGSYKDKHPSYRKGIGLSNIYQSLGRCHRTFSPHKKVFMNIYCMYHHDYLEKKLKYFFSEYFVNKDDNFKKIADRINNMNVGGKVRANNKDVKKLGPRAPTIDINTILEHEKYKNVKIDREEDDYKVILTITCSEDK